MKKNLPAPCFCVAGDNYIVSVNKKFLRAFLFLIVLIFASQSSAEAEVYKFTFNPFTNRMDIVTNVSSTSIGSLLDVSTASLMNGNCLVWNSATSQFEAGSCGGSASFAFAVSTNGVIISSPTSNINFLPPFQGSLDGSSTAQIRLDVTSVTLQGQTVLSFSSATATYLQLSSAVATYLQNSSATATYLQLSSAVATYLQNSTVYVTSLTVNAPITLSGSNNVTASAPIISLTQNAGTDITADLEEESHGSEHQDNGPDEISVTGLSGLLADPQTIVVSTNGFVVNTSSGINFQAGSNVSLSAVATSSNTLITISATASGGGAPWPIAVSTNGVIISSPTTNINFMPPFQGTLNGQSTAQITLNPSSATLLGPTIEVAEISNVNAGTDLTADLEEEAHVTEHQNNGADELNVADLSGLLADPQKITVSTNGTVVNISSGINFVQGTNITLTAVSLSSVTTLTIAGVAGGSGDVTDVNAGYGISVANPGGPAPTVNLISDATAYIQNRNTLQAGATAYVNFVHAVTSGTINSGVFQTSLQLPNGTGPTVDLVGKMAVDTTENQLIWFDSTSELVVPSTYSKSMSIQNADGNDFPYFWKPHKDITLLYAVCVSSANNAVINIQECNSNGASCSIITTDTTCGTTEANIIINDTAIAAGNRLRVKIVSDTSPLYTGIDVYYRETRK